MKMNYIIIATIGVLLTGCFLLPFDKSEYAFSPIPVVGGYFDILYINDNYGIHNNKVYFGQKQNIFPCSGECEKYGYSKQINFYQDIEKQCFLFSVNSEFLIGEFIRKRHEIGREYAGEDYIRASEAYRCPSKKCKEREKIEKGVVVLVDNGKVEIVSSAEYNQLKIITKSHPYDQSLCKPKPVSD
jgi:hypothetical protein